jgi:hypothetical protein
MYEMPVALGCCCHTGSLVLFGTVFDCSRFEVHTFQRSQVFEVSWFGTCELWNS